MTDSSELLELTAEIVSAHVTNNTVAVGDLPNLIASVHQALANLGSEAKAATGEISQKIPAVSVRASVKPDYLVCLECGAKQKVLKRHLQSAHGMTPQQYRAEYGLPASYPMSAPAYSEIRKGLAKAAGLGRKPGQKRGRRPNAAKGA